MNKIDSIEITGISIEEATLEALEQLGAREDEVAVEVLVTPRAGVLGLGTRYARVRATRKSALPAEANPPAAPPAPTGARDDDSGSPGRKSADLEEQRREAMVILKQILEQMGEPTDVRQIEV